MCATNALLGRKLYVTEEYCASCVLDTNHGTKCRGSEMLIYICHVCQHSRQAPQLNFKLLKNEKLIHVMALACSSLLDIMIILSESNHTPPRFLPRRGVSAQPCLDLGVSGRGCVPGTFFCGVFFCRSKLSQVYQGKQFAKLPVMSTFSILNWYIFELTTRKNPTM